MTGGQVAPALHGFGGRLVLGAADYRRNRSLWLKARRSGLGASDTAAVLGLSEPWKTALDVWQDKTAAADPVESEASEAAAWGQLLEAAVARRTVAVHPELGKLVPTPGLLAHPDYPWMLATVDFGLAARGSRSAPVRELLEVKTTSRDNYRQKWTDGVPPAAIQVQCQQQLAVTGFDICWVTCLVGGQQLAEPFKVERSETVIRQLVEYAGGWWADYVETRRRPDPTFGDADKLAGLYVPDDSLDPLPATAELEEIFADLLDARRRVKAWQADADAAEFKLKTALAERTALTSAAGEVLATWKPQTSRRLDQKALAADHPELVKRYKPAKTSRVFRVKDEEL